MRRFLFAGCLILAGLAYGLEPRGVRNRNCGNLRPNNIVDLSKWPGAIAVDDQGHLIFAQHVDGVRAIVICLKKYRDRGIKSPHGIIFRWTGKGVDSESKRSYVKFLCQRLGVFEWSLLNLNDAKTLEIITRTIIHFENGYDPYTESLYAQVFPKRMK